MELLISILVMQRVRYNELLPVGRLNVRAALSKDLLHLILLVALEVSNSLDNISIDFLRDLRLNKVEV